MMRPVFGPVFSKVGDAQDPDSERTHSSRSSGSSHSAELDEVKHSEVSESSSQKICRGSSSLFHPDLCYDSHAEHGLFLR